MVKNNKILILYYNPIFLLDLYGKLKTYNNCNIYIEHISIFDKNHYKIYDAIIPSDFESQEYINNNNINCFKCKKNIYELLDNKREILSIFKKKKLKNIKIIPTLEEINLDSINKFIKKHDSNQYVLKHVKGYAGAWQDLFKKKELTNIDFKIYKDYILQPRITKFKLYSFDAVCKNGKNIDFIVSSYKNFSNFEYNLLNIKNLIELDIIKNGEIYDKVVSNSKKIINYTKYSGIIDIEYIVKENEVYLLEINPRISGNIICFDNLSKNGLYFNSIIIPYLKEQGIILENKIEYDKNVKGKYFSYKKIFFYLKTIYSLIVNCLLSLYPIFTVLIISFFVILLYIINKFLKIFNYSIKKLTYFFLDIKILSFFFITFLIIVILITYLIYTKINKISLLMLKISEYLIKIICKVYPHKNI